MDLVVSIQGIAQLDAAWRKAPAMVERELKAATWEAELLMQREVQELTPVGAHGVLRESITAEAPQVMANNVIGVVGTSVNYAVAVELGTKPHWAPIEPILEWVRLRLGIPEKEAERVANAIRFNIAAHGTPAVGMFHRGFNASRAQVLEIYSRAFNRITQQLAPGGA